MSESIKIIPQLDLENSSNEFVFPNFSVTTINKTEDSESVATFSHIRANFSEIDAKLMAVKHQLELPESITTHDIHQYVMMYIILALVVVACVIIGKKLYGNRSPVPAPRTFITGRSPANRAISMPDLTPSLPRENVD